MNLGEKGEENSVLIYKSLKPYLFQLNCAVNMLWSLETAEMIGLFWNGVSPCIIAPS